MHTPNSRLASKQPRRELAVAPSLEAGTPARRPCWYAAPVGAGVHPVCPGPGCSLSRWRRLSYPPCSPRGVGIREDRGSPDLGCHPARGWGSPTLLQQEVTPLQVLLYGSEQESLDLNAAVCPRH